MITITKSVKHIDTQNISNYLDISNTFFFDIETTGFSRQANICYLIGVIFFKDENAYYTQWFCEHPKDEINVIKALNDFSKSFKNVIHFNGDAFDIPFIRERCKHLNTSFELDHLNSIDLLKIAKQCKNLLRFENYKQKNIEAFLSINREDKYSGGELIEVYNNYIQNPNDTDLNLLLLHNRDDIIGMPSLLPIIAYKNIINYNFSFKECNLNNNELILKLLVEHELPTPLHLIHEDIHILAKCDTISIVIPIIECELKHFYPDYKNYYYLPNEDKAIHKSVATFVDNSFKEKAKPHNCYTKINNKFIIKPKEYDTHAFKKEYKDKLEFMQLSEFDINNPSQILEYAKGIISTITMAG